MAKKNKLDTVFTKIELNYSSITTQIYNWLSSKYEKSSITFNSASPYGQILEVLKELFRQNIMSLKNFVKQLDITQSNSKRMISNIARISGHNPARTISANGTLKFKLKQGINLNTEIIGSQVIIYNNTILKNKQNSLFYSLKTGNEKSFFPLLNGSQFFINIVQGKYENQIFTGDGTNNQSFQVNVSNNASIDNFDIIITLNGVNVDIKDHLNDLLPDEYACWTRTGFNGGLDIYFGNSINGVVPKLASTIKVTYLLNNGLDGNILNNIVNDFTFIDDVYDSAGNTLQVSKLFDIYVETDIKFASDGESIEYTKSVIPYVSRNFVLATPDQFIYHLKKLNIFSKVNAFNTLDMVRIDVDNDGDLDDVNINEMYLYLIPRITDYFSNSINYFNVAFDAFYLDDVEKARIITYIKKQGIVSITANIKILDPIIKKYIVNIFIRRYSDISKDNIRNQIVNTLSDYFSTYNRYDRIVKANIISLLKRIDGIDSINLEFVGKANEDYHKNSTLNSKKQTVIDSTFITNRNSVEVSSDNYKTIVKDNNNTSTELINSITIDGETVSVGDSTILSYKKTETNSYDTIGIDPVLGDIIIENNELVILRGGWTNRNGVFFGEDPTSKSGLNTINIIWKGETDRS